ncbi:hypothetical protein BDV93DRAFT_539157 [Ceratobasidium sp. AG-I]|nr:hypothetical protein BDV93DRAFT_539157 [Ceratobasidium sp. AG-I]
MLGVESSVTEIAVAAVTVAVGAAFYFGTPRTIPEEATTETETEPGRPSTSSKKGGKKNKKKTIPGLRATSGEESTAAEEPVAPKRVEKEKEKELTPKPESIPPTTASKTKKKKKTQSAKPAAEPDVGPSQRAAAAASESSSANDGAWTRVETRRRTGASVPAGVLSDGVTTSVTGTEDEQEDAPQEPKQRTLAERMLPTGRKTGVEDMLETPQYPEVARVMRVKPDEGQAPAPGYTWGDYEDVDDNKVISMDDDETDEGGWGVVKSRKPQRSQTLTQASSTQSSKISSDAQSKKQRQNAAKRDAAKAAKVETEAERLAKLQSHKRALERERIAEQYAKPAPGKGKASGGMTASVNEKGSLVWD